MTNFVLLSLPCWVTNEGLMSIETTKLLFNGKFETFLS